MLSRSTASRCTAITGVFTKGASIWPFSVSLAVFSLLVPISASWAEEQEAARDDALIEEVVVAANRTLGPRLDSLGSYQMLSATTIARTGATHANEALVRVPGVWVSRGSGQEQLTAIRSAVLTGSGACGAFLFAENGVPIRPSGFCNVNNLFEVNTEQAAAIEVWRGPASAVLGGNALRGAINVVSGIAPNSSISIEGGPYDYVRGDLRVATDIGEQRLGINLQSTHSGGYRDDTGYGQQKLSVVHQAQWAGWDVTNTFSASLLNQETGGFVRGFEAYEDSDLQDTNPNPEAFRDAWALRLASHWQRGAWTITPYARRSQMAFFQHFLPGQPLENNEQSSAGALVSYEVEGERLSMRFGGQAELMQGSLSEFQSGPTISGSAFLVATRPSGLHYDYDIDSNMVAGFYDLDWRASDTWRVVHSARVERLRYDYDNLTLVGNTRDDGTVCGFGGCRYTRPADSKDTFTDLAGRLGVERALGDGHAYLSLGTGFRAPQATELYRLQDGQAVADIDSERLTSLEVGVRMPNWQVAAFRQRSKNLIFRDSDGFNVDNGRTESVGIEAGAQLQWAGNEFDVAATYARHRYDFNSPLGGGELIERGNMVDTAPRWLGSAHWRRPIGERGESELELVHVGKHFVNASNTAEYDGHWLVNWRGSWQVAKRSEIYVRVVNLLDEEYADRADFAFGSYRYFPGMPRQFYLGFRQQL